VPERDNTSPHLCKRERDGEGHFRFSELTAEDYYNVEEDENISEASFQC